MTKEFLTGNEAAIVGAITAGAQMMTGYPITPTTEMIEHWASEVVKNPELKFLQTEDEMAAGFAMIGGVLAGQKCFTATAGPGNVLMQDAFSMAENLRLPTVAFINQRGGPSTGTVIYSQQELNLTCFGGNGEGLRIVYSCSSVQDMYTYALKSFNIAWRYRFPTFVLSDGYLAKTLTEIEIFTPAERQIEIANASPYFLKTGKPSGVYEHLRNTYNLESELYNIVLSHTQALEEVSPEIIEFEDIHTLDAEVVIFAHGIMAASARQAVDFLRSDNKKIGLFRPITLNPFPKDNAKAAASGKKLILILESSLGQFEKLVKNYLYGLNIPIQSLKKPAMGITPDEIIEKVNALFKELE